MKHHYLIIKILKYAKQKSRWKIKIKVEMIIHNVVLPEWIQRSKRESQAREGRPLMKKGQDMNGIARKQEKLVKKVVNLLAVETVDVNY
jgi:vacuolar-type H+-ATPase subunit D/Vma8